MARSSKKSAATVSEEIRKGITDKIVECLKAGKIPWARPWTDDPNSGAPCNIASKKRYSGINPLILQLTSLERGFYSKHWGTYGQWAALGGQVKKRPDDVEPGRWGANVVFYKVIEKENKKSDGTLGPPSKIFFLRTYTIFNVDQVEGEKLDKYRAKVHYASSPNSFDVNYELAERVIKATGADIRHGGNRAVYTRPYPDNTFPKHSGGDHITMPSQDQFLDLSEYYFALFHETAHWSEVRLNWDHDSHGYAMGELAAEITACYLAEETKIPNKNFSNHANYLGSWLEKMQNDTKWIFKAATQASKAADYIMSFSDVDGSEDREQEPSEDIEEGIGLDGSQAA